MFGSNRKVANAKERKSTPKGEGIVMATTPQRRPKGLSYKVQMEGLAQHRWDGPGCCPGSQLHHALPGTQGNVWCRQAPTEHPFQGAHWRQKAASEQSKASTENSAPIKNLSYLSKKQTILSNYYELVGKTQDIHSYFYKLKHRKMIEAPCLKEYSQTPKEYFCDVNIYWEGQ